MAPRAAIHVVGRGAVTAVGATSAVAMAAAQAGLSRLSLVPEDADPDDDGVALTNVAALSTLALEDPVARGRALLRQAIAQAAGRFDGAGAAAARPIVGVFLAGPPLPDAQAIVAGAVAPALGAGLTAVQAGGAHGSAALLAVAQAARALEKDEIDLALVAGFDVRSDPASVAAALPTERTIGPDRSWGYVPGEGAAALLLVGDRGLRRLGLRAQATLLAVAEGYEPTTLGGPRPCTGTGVTEAVQRALAALPPDGRAAAVLCDLNGERTRADEWGFTIPRVAERLVDPSAFVAPTIAWGDCGAANGLLLLDLAISLGARSGGDAGMHLLAWTSGDGHERAAVLVHARGAAPGSHAGDAASTAAAAPSAAPAPAAPPAWVKALDQEMVAEMAEELAFRYEQRAFLVHGTAPEEAPSEEPPNAEAPRDFGAVERAEEALDALALGLAECGAPARETVTAAVALDAPGTLYAAVRTLLEAGRVSEAVELGVEHMPIDRALEEAALDAFRHARHPDAAPRLAAAALLAAGPALAFPALELAAATRTPVPPSAIDALARDLPGERAAAFAFALGRLRDPSGGAHLAAMAGDQGQAHAVRCEVAVAEALLGGPAAVEKILSQVESDSALLLPAALVVDRRRAARLLEIAAAAAGVQGSTSDGNSDGDGDGVAAPTLATSAIWAAALAGDPAAVPWLLDRLAVEPLAGAAAAALELLLGATPIEEHDVPDEDAAAPPRRTGRVSQRRDDWQPIANRILSAHAPSLRMRGGAAASAAAAMPLLERAHLPFQLRRWLGLELAVRHSLQPVFDPGALMRVQRSWLAGARQPPRQQPGAWDVPRPSPAPGRGGG